MVIVAVAWAARITLEVPEDAAWDDVLKRTPPRIMAVKSDALRFMLSSHSKWCRRRVSGASPPVALAWAGSSGQGRDRRDPDGGQWYLGSTGRDDIIWSCDRHLHRR